MPVCCPCGAREYFKSSFFVRSTHGAQHDVGVRLAVKQALFILVLEYALE